MRAQSKGTLSKAVVEQRETMACRRASMIASAPRYLGVLRYLRMTSIPRGPCRLQHVLCPPTLATSCRVAIPQDDGLFAVEIVEFGRCSYDRVARAVQQRHLYVDQDFVGVGVIAGFRLLRPSDQQHRRGCIAFIQ